MPFAYHSRPVLVVLALVMTVVQALDALIGVSIGDGKETWGPASTAVLNGAALIWLVA